MGRGRRRAVRCERPPGGYEGGRGRRGEHRCGQPAEILGLGPIATRGPPELLLDGVGERHALLESRRSGE